MFGQALRVEGGNLIHRANGTIHRKPLLALLLSAPSWRAARARPICCRRMRTGFRAPAAVHQKRFDRNAAADARTSRSRRMIWSAPTAIVPGWRRRPVPTRWPTALPARRRPRRRGRWRWVIPNATSCAASARPTASICPTIARGDRVAVVNYTRGQRAGIYTFTAGRLSSIERGAGAGAAAASRRRSRRRRNRREDG